MQVVGAHTLEEHRKTKGVIQYHNCIMTSYTITTAEEIPAHIQGQRGPPTMVKTKRVRWISLDNCVHSEGKNKSVKIRVVHSILLSVNMCK